VSVLSIECVQYVECVEYVECVDCVECVDGAESACSVVLGVLNRLVECVVS